MMSGQQQLANSESYNFESLIHFSLCPPLIIIIVQVILVLLIISLR